LLLMIGSSHLPINQLNNQTFLYSGTWQIWTKPKNISMVSILCIGGGSGGGSGIGNSTTTGGGAGGSSAGVARFLVSASILPNNLFINVGLGGAGGAGIIGGAGNMGASGSPSYVSFSQSTTSSFLLLKSENVSATGSFGGINGGGSAAQTAATVSTTALSLFSNLGIFSAIAGQLGGAGNSTAGGNITPAGIICAGAGGGGQDLTTAYAGGNITGTGQIPTVLGGQVPSGNGVSIAVNSGIFFATGGSGGSGAVGAVTAGSGGNGGYGCGGGGGGSNGSGAVGGNGGSGGNGIIIISCW
jgi:hypothetical protein